MKEEVVGRWGDGRRADSDFAREQILDAAVRCFQENTFQQTRMEHIAREAKVSRQTIYRYFKNREEMVFGVLFRELQQLLEQIRSRVDGMTSFAEFVVETLTVANEQIQNSVAVGLIVRESTILMSRMHLESEDIAEFVGGYFRPRFDAAMASGELREGLDFDDLVDWTMHIGSTYILLPSERSNPEEFRRMLWYFYIPSIMRDTAAPKLGRM